MIGSGDLHAKEILGTYHSMMPSFSGLQEEQMDQLISFMHTKKAAKKEKEDPLAIKDPIPEKIEASRYSGGPGTI